MIVYNALCANIHTTAGHVYAQPHVDCLAPGCLVRILRLEGEKKKETIDKRPVAHQVGASMRQVFVATLSLRPSSFCLSISRTPETHAARGMQQQPVKQQLYYTNGDPKEES
ncbi:hypothetical protein OUZ56_022778 [Daphnia magna]|uniref:Uncharacterized protein n=1 Tax=Daphnia magna TaxID=35525 RepID=A0ABR0AXG9_9CRUS|nr:hypothetical protein OUZ56_022778 [Daphnia magna]